MIHVRVEAARNISFAVEGNNEKSTREFGLSDCARSACQWDEIVEGSAIPG